MTNEVWSEYEEVDPEDIYFEEKAEFCLRTGIAPSEYDNLTKKETAAFIKIFKKLNSNKQQ